MMVLSRTDMIFYIYIELNTVSQRRHESRTENMFLLFTPAFIGCNKTATLLWDSLYIWQRTEGSKER